MLGGFRAERLPDNTDLDTVLTTGLYYSTSDTIVNGGIDMGLWLIFAAKLTATIYAVLQVGCDTRARGANPIKYRGTWTTDTNGWSAWKSISAS